MVTIFCYSLFMTTLYRCTGSCHGVSDKPGVCQAESCELYHEPLEEVEQCAACANVAAKDGKLHTCDECEVC